MSRLDDELRRAFRREEPPADFTARVLARLDEPLPQAKPSRWRAILSIFEMPRLGWAMAAAALVVVAIVSVWQFAPRQSAIDTNNGVASTEPQPVVESPKIENKAAPEIATRNEKVKTDAASAPNKIDRKARPAIDRRQVIAKLPAPKVDPEAEAAKQKVLFALQLASDTLNDAQRAIQGETPKSNTERNR